MTECFSKGMVYIRCRSVNTIVEVGERGREVVGGGMNG